KKKQRKFIASVRKQFRRPVNLYHALLSTLIQTGTSSFSSLPSEKNSIFFLLNEIDQNIFWSDQ
ncbi:hypothetical protein AKJ18_27250, partial [Vibrio xuii]